MKTLDNGHYIVIKAYKFTVLEMFLYFHNILHVHAILHIESTDSMVIKSAICIPKYHSFLSESDIFNFAIIIH